MATPKLTLGERCYVLRNPATGTYLGVRGALQTLPRLALRWPTEEAAQAALTSAAVELGSPVALEVERWEVCVTTSAPDVP